MSDYLVGILTGLAIGIVMVLLSIRNEPTNTGHWECTDWQIVNFKPVCNVMTRQGDR